MENHSNCIKNKNRGEEHREITKFLQLNNTNNEMRRTSGQVYQITNEQNFTYTLSSVNLQQVFRIEFFSFKESLIFLIIPTCFESLARSSTVSPLKCEKYEIQRIKDVTK